MSGSGPFIISISNLWRADVGTTETVPFAGIIVDTDNKSVPVDGSVKLTRLDEDELMAEFAFTAKAQEECVRCLRQFADPHTIRNTEVYSRVPAEDQFPVSKRLEIDLEPALLQAHLLSLCSFPLHDPNCKGLAIKE